MRVASRMRPEGRMSLSAVVTTSVEFVWDVVEGATSYVLKVGPATEAYTTFDNDVGNVLHKTLSLVSGTYYSIVVPYDDATPMTATAEQTVVVP